METLTGTDISKAVELLQHGNLVAIPTETVYGLAGNALDEQVVMQIFKTKNRPEFNPLIVHIASVNHVEKYVESVPDEAFRLMEKFWPGPLTLLLKKKSIIPDITTSGLDTVAIRIPNHPMTLSLLNELDFPLAAPSANPFGYISPTSAQHVLDQLNGKIAYILNGGACNVGIESTIAGFEDGQLIIYRLGGTTISEIESVAGVSAIRIPSSSDLRAPGMLKSHYAPSVPLYFGEIEELIRVHDNDSIAVLCFTGENLPKLPENSVVVKLSPEGNLEVAARNLFAALRHLDRLNIKCILAEPFPVEGLGKAINDRLLRASVRE